MRQETLQRLIHDYLAENGPDLPLYVSSLIEQERMLKAKLIEIHQKLKDEDIRYERTTKGILHQLGDVRLECPHHEMTCHGNPADGNDSFRTCDLCGAEVRK